MELIISFISHVDEFENTRLDDEKFRQILFPKEINSIFGISPVDDYMVQSTETLENFVTKLIEQKKFINIGDNEPYIRFLNQGKSETIFLKDTPRLRQLYYNYKCFKSTGVRLNDLNFVLKYLKTKTINYTFEKVNNLREILINGVKIIFVYEYCLSKINILKLSPQENSIIVNLHNWNGHNCISQEAYDLSQNLNIKLLTMDEFYEYINKIRRVE